MQQQCNHNEFCDAPVVGAFQSNGRTVYVHGRGDLNEIILRMKLLTRHSGHSLPLNATTKQVSAIADEVAYGD